MELSAVAILDLSNSVVTLGITFDFGVEVLASEDGSNVVTTILVVVGLPLRSVSDPCWNFLLLAAIVYTLTKRKNIHDRSMCILLVSSHV